MNQNAAKILQWYVDSGVDEIIGDKPFNHFIRPAPKMEKRHAVSEGESHFSPAPSISNIPVVTPSAAMAEARALADNAKTLDELFTAIREFNGCALKRTATNTVLYDGNLNAKLMLIGEAPGAEEDKQGIPFCGASGQLLDKMLASIGIDRTSCLITNTIYWRPPGNRNPSPEETAICKPFVEKFVSLLDPKLIVLVGGIATKAMLGTEQGITKLRGKPYDYKTPYSDKSYSVALTFHPSYLLRSPAQKRFAWHDMLAIKKTMDS